MAKPQLSGKMIRLNGINQYLIGTFPAKTWNAMFLRICFHPTDWQEYTRICDYYMADGYGRLHIYTYQADWAQVVYSHFHTSDVVRNPERRTGPGGSGTSVPEGPVDLVMVWTGSELAVYHGGRIKYRASCPGTFSGGANNFLIGSIYSLGNYFKGDIGHVILHDAVPTPYTGLPDQVYDGQLTATEFLRVHGLTEDDVLCLWDYRDPNNPGRNYGNGGSTYDLTPYNNPLVLDNDFQYELVDETTPIIEYPQAIVMGARLRVPRLRGKLRTEL